MKHWERWRPLTGLLAAVGMFIGTLFVLDQPQDSDSNAKIVSYFAQHSHRVEGIIGFFVFLAGILLLLAFLATLRDRLATAEGGHGRLAALAYGGGVASAAIWIVAMLLARATSFTVSETSKFHVDPNTYRLLGDTAYWGWISATALAALVVWGTSAVALSTTVLPRWFGRLGVVTGVVQLFGIFFFPFFAWWIWLALASLLLVQRPRTATAARAIAPTT
jgi:hypothetical protein